MKTGRDPLAEASTIRHLKWPVLLTRAGMVAESAVRAFWPLWTLVCLVVAPLLFGWHDLMGLELFWGYAVASLIGLLAALVWGVMRFRWPSRAAAVARVDARLPGRPIAAIGDSQAIGRGDPASEAVWRAHVARMEKATRNARAVEPDLRVSDRDPFGLRYMALIFLAAALLFGSILRVATVTDVATPGQEQLAAGPVWEGWVQPPAYTGKPTLYLNDIPAGPLQVPVGSEIILRLYGDVGALTVAETVSGRVDDLGSASEAQQSFAVTQSGELAIEGENGIRWDVTAVADAPPEVQLTGEIETDALGEFSQPFRGRDDYAVERGTATFALDLDRVDRQHGLAVAPDPIPDLVLDLPMPFTGDRAAFDEFLIDDLSEHPLANLPVTLTLSVADAAEQVGQSTPREMILPGRRFFQPVARAVIEQRRDLMWAKANAPRVAQILRAVSHRPEDLFTNQTTYLRMRTIIRRLETFDTFGLSDEAQAEVVQALWDLAIQLEEGTLADARERLRRAQERLAEAMRNGASDEEIAELMDELRAATDDYMRMLAEQAEPGENGLDEPDMAQNGENLSWDEIQALMDRIQELMEEGRMAEAQQLMEQLNQLLENLRVTQGEGGEGGPRMPGQQSMEDLAETLREQEDLSDEAFRELQERGRQQGQQGEQQGQQGQNGQPGQPGQDAGQGEQGQEPGQGNDGGRSGDQTSPGQEGREGQQDGTGQGGERDGLDAESLAERQRALREELDRQQGQLPNLDGEAGEMARDSLERAEGAMEGAEGALEEGDLAEAIDQQAEAMDALRDGMRALGEALQRNAEAEPGQGQQDGETASRREPGRRDPLGREVGNSGQFGTDQDMLQGQDVYRRAEEILDELRRRSAEQQRPQVERDYLKRLLDKF